MDRIKNKYLLNIHYVKKKKKKIRNILWPTYPE